SVNSVRTAIAPSGTAGARAPVRQLHASLRGGKMPPPPPPPLPPPPPPPSSAPPSGASPTRYGPRSWDAPRAAPVMSSVTPNGAPEVSRPGSPAAPPAPGASAATAALHDANTCAGATRGSASSAPGSGTASGTPAPAGGIAAPAFQYTSNEAANAPTASPVLRYGCGILPRVSANTQS